MTHRQFKVLLRSLHETLRQPFVRIEKAPSFLVSLAGKRKAFVDKIELAVDCGANLLKLSMISNGGNKILYWG